MFPIGSEQSSSATVRNHCFDFLPFYAGCAMSQTVATIGQELLLAHVLRKSREWLIAHPEVHLTPAQRRRYSTLLRRLSRGEPLAYLLGTQWFYGRPFTVNHSVLIPRPETELMIELALDRIKNHGTPDSPPKAACPSSGGDPPLADRFQILDIGTGSGCIAITLARELPKRISNLKFQIIATDASPAALRVARANARRHGVLSRINFFRRDLLGPVLNTFPTPSHSPSRREVEKKSIPQFGILPSAFCVVANLPYLTTAEWHALPRSIRDYEPRLALNGGPDGLTHFRELFTQVRKIPIIHDSLFMILEIDPRRKRALAALVRKTLPDWGASWHRDLAGRWRVITLNAPTAQP